jgi:NADH-quinone oxidoreductase subunit H
MRHALFRCGPIRAPRGLAVVVALLAVLALAALTACQRDAGPQLIEALDLVPHEVERGDRVELIGASFPAGKKAHVTFRGELHRPGEKAASAEIAAEGSATSTTQIELELTEGLEQLFCGVGAAGEGSVHTTFTGDVEVAFPSATAGAPPVVATLHGATLDVRPPTPRRALLDARTKEGLGALAYLGIHTSKTLAPSGGLLVEGVDLGSRAEKANIQVGDLLVRFDGVEIASPADVIPRGGTKTATMMLRRGASKEDSKREIAVDGFRASPPADLYGAGLLLVLAAAVLVFFMAPTAGLLTWLERRIAARMRSPSPSDGAPPPGLFALASGGIKALLREDVVASTDKPLLRAAPYLVFVAVSASFVVIPFGQSLIAADLDVGILYVLAVTSLATIGLLSGGWASRNKYSLLGGIRSAAQIVSYEVPGAIAVACIVMMTGSLRLQEIIHAQGGWPWDWYLFKSPVTVALFFLYFTTALAQGSRAPLDFPEADGEPALASPASPAEPAGKRRLFAFFLQFAEWANVFVMSGIAAALFLGGWQVPGLSEGAQEAHVGLQALGAAVFLVKSWALIFTVLWIRWALPRLPVDQRMVLCWKWLVPMAFAAFALSAGWVVWSPARATQVAMGAVMFAVFCVGMARVVQRVRYNLRMARQGSQGQLDLRLNPFL